MSGPLDLQGLTDQLAQLQSTVEALSNSRQPTIGDWNALNPAGLSYSTANFVNVAPDYRSILNTLQIGDKIRLNGNFFWLCNITSTGFGIDGGDNYTFLNAAITSIAYSRISHPFGWPDRQQFVKNNIVAVLTGSASVNTIFRRRVYFSMEGPLVRATYSFSYRFNSGTISILRAPLPLAGIGVLNSNSVIAGPGEGAYTASSALEMVYPFLEVLGSNIWPNYVAISVLNNNIGQGGAPGQDMALDIEVYYSITGG